MKFPKKLKVGPYDYKVLGWDTQAWAAGRRGECDPLNKIIRIADGLPDQLRTETLIHEILHSVYSTMHINDEDDEETTVTKMATGLAMVFRDNPKLKELL